MIDWEDKAELNFVPFIDVMLVLLIIFMIAGQTKPSESAINVELPTSSNETVAANTTDTPNTIIITRSVDGIFMTYPKQSIQDKPMTDVGTLAGVVGTLKRNNPDIQVFLRGDKKLPYGDITEIASELSKFGLENVSLVMEDIPR